MRAFRETWRGLTPLTRRLLVFALLNGVVLDLALMGLFLTPWRLTIFGQVAQFATATQGEDSWGPMLRAFAYVHEDHARPVYDEIFFDQQYKFQYPPTTLLFLYVLKPLGAVAGKWPLGTLDLVSWLALAVTLGLTVRLFERSLDVHGPGARSGIPESRAAGGAERVTRVAVVLFLGLTFYPAVKAYTLGQVQVWINAMFAAALWAWIIGRERVSGALLGTACLIKPQYGLFVLWGVLRRRWGFLSAFAITAAAGLLCSVALFGWADHLNYLDVLSFISRRGESYYPNQSVNGLLHRLLFNGYNLGWKGRYFPPFHPAIYLLTVTSSVILIAVGLLWRTSGAEKGGIAEFCIVGLTCTLASPVAWEHHYGILLPIYAWIVPRVLRERPFGRGTVPYLTTSYVLCSNFLAASTALAAIPVANVGQSYLLAGALMAWIALLVLRARGPAPPVEARA